MDRDNMDDFEVGIVPLDGEVVIALRGDLDASAADVLHDEVRPLTGRYDGDQMTFDCTAITSVDAHGLEGLLRIGRIPRGSGRLGLVDPVGLVRAALIGSDDGTELFNLDDHGLQSATGS
jgi:hypothetical protein